MFQGSRISTIKNVDFGKRPLGFDYTFSDCQSLKAIPSTVKFPKFTNCDHMFYQCGNLKSIQADMDFSLLGISGQSMQSAFYWCTVLEMDIDKVQLTINDTDNKINWYSTFSGCNKLSGTVDANKFWKKYDYDTFETLNTFSYCSKLSNYNQIPIQWGGINPGEYEFRLNFYGQTLEQPLSMWDNPNIWQNEDGYWPYDWCEIKFDKLQSNPGRLAIEGRPSEVDDEIYYTDWLVIPQNIENGTYRTQIKVYGMTYDEDNNQILSQPSIWVCNVVVNDKIYAMPQYFQSVDSWQVMTFNADGIPYGNDSFYSCLGSQAYGYCSFSTQNNAKTFIVSYEFSRPGKIKQILSLVCSGWGDQADTVPTIIFQDYQGNQIYRTTDFEVYDIQIPDDIPFNTGGYIKFELPPNWYWQIINLNLTVQLQ